MRQPSIHELAVIGDRSTCALVDRDGTLCWYCPERFDAPAVFSSLLDAERGGYWSVDATGKSYAARAYVERSGILETHFTIDGEPFAVTDWMGMGAEKAVYRRFSRAPRDVVVTMRARAAYGVHETPVRLAAPATAIYAGVSLRLRSSHPLEVTDDRVSFRIPAGDAGWAVLDGNVDAPAVTEARIAASYDSALGVWKTLGERVRYDGPFEGDVRDSIRALQLLTYEATGGVIAAATTSLPEVIGGERNYDYRYVWVRDISLIVSGLLQFDTVGAERRCLSFIARALVENDGDGFAPYYDVDGRYVCQPEEVPLTGYRASRPVLIGNAASGQLQLDADGSVLLAARLVYERFDERVEWDAIAATADYLSDRWRLDDNGIWEEGVRKPYTSSKVFAARGLEFMARYCTGDPTRARRWMAAAADIRTFVHEHCLTSSGAFAVYAGSDEVDVSAAQFAFWSYCEPDATEMLATVAALERDWCRDDLYWRRLEEPGPREEGSFLAASCWMSHYYSIAGDLERARRIIEAVRACGNDLGLFAEEARVDDGVVTMLGNFPQTIVHSSFIGAVHGYKMALDGLDSRIR